MDGHTSFVPLNFFRVALLKDTVPIHCPQALRSIDGNKVGAVLALKDWTTVGQRKSHDSKIGEQPKLNLSDKSKHKIS